MLKPKNSADQLDVDVRFLLANERTLLAWIRTSLAIQAGGIALATVHKHQPIIGIAVLLLGALSVIIGYHRFRAADKAIRNHHLPPRGTGASLQVYGIVAITIILAILQLTVLR